MVFVNIFEVQYVLNWLIYVVRSDQYRNAFLYVFIDYRKTMFDYHKRHGSSNEMKALNVVEDLSE